MERQAHILVVDDEKYVTQLFQRTLEAAGYAVNVANEGNSAISIIMEKEPDLVLLDIMMPDKSGIELLKEIKAIYPDMSLIMVSAVKDTTTAIHCMKQGAYDYITKPFTLDTVLLSVGRALEKKRLEIENREYKQNLEKKVEEQAKKIRASFVNVLTALVYAIDAKDRYTTGHSERVSRIAVDISRELGMPEENIEKIRIAGLLHDIGKIGTSETILNKPGKLTDREFQSIISHCETGQRILSPVVDDEEILKAVIYHHEHYDGSGYPDGLSGSEIPEGAKILAIADAYDAMTSERPYRSAMSEEAARAELVKGKLTQFDPEAVDAFLGIAKKIK